MWLFLLLSALLGTAQVARGFHGAMASGRVSGLASSRCALKMSSPPSEWLTCKVVTNRKEAEGLRFIEIATSAACAAQYTSPGQYVKIKVGEGKPGFYAIASPPDASREVMQFIVKETENNAYIAASKAGDTLDVSMPQGKGFQIVDGFDKYKNDFPAFNVLLMATGSGLAPIAAAIDYAPLALRKVGANSLYERTATLYLGARSENHLPFRSKFGDWESKGVKIIPVLSQPGNSWKGKTGYIQDALKETGVATPRNTGALLCGHRGMTDNVKDFLLESGVFEGRILFNF